MNLFYQFFLTKIKNLIFVTSKSLILVQQVFSTVSKSWSVSCGVSFVQQRMLLLHMGQCFIWPVAGPPPPFSFGGRGLPNDTPVFLEGLSCAPHAPCLPPPPLAPEGSGVTCMRQGLGIKCGEQSAGLERLRHNREQQAPLRLCDTREWGSCSNTKSSGHWRQDPGTTDPRFTR